MSAMAILTDVTRCTGCEKCVVACKQQNHDGPDTAFAWQRDPSGLSATRRTTILSAPGGRFARMQCRHCLDPACVQACIVAALRKNQDGAVTYDPSVCIGCRYCMIVCPFELIRYEWGSAAPKVIKCTLCWDAVHSGQIREPACIAACPTKATIFGTRDELLAEAKRRIRSGGYIDHVWGEHELGGTSVLYVSDVDLAGLGWPQSASWAKAPELTRKIMHMVPPAFFGVGLTMAGISWIVGRRRQLAAQKEAAASPPPAQPSAPAGDSGQDKTEGKK
jgi:formate dehydrogenase iron-sulfur subunit